MTTTHSQHTPPLVNKLYLTLSLFQPVPVIRTLIPKPVRALFPLSSQRQGRSIGIRNSQVASRRDVSSVKGPKMPSMSPRSTRGVHLWNHLLAYAVETLPTDVKPSYANPRKPNETLVPPQFAMSRSLYPPTSGGDPWGSGLRKSTSRPGARLAGQSPP